MKRRILPRAARDIAAVEAFLSTENPEAARSVGSRLQKVFELVTDRPQIGRPTSISNVREWSVPGLPYVIPYRVRGDIVEILRVFHTRRQKPPKWIG